MLHIRVHTDKGERLVDPPAERLEELHRVAGNNIWVDMDGATQEELHLLAHVFGLLDLTVEDLSQDAQRAKLEAFDGYNVLIMHGMVFYPDDLHIEVPEIDIVLGKNFLITSHRGLLSVVQDPQGPNRDCIHLAKGPTFALYRVVDRLVDSYYPVLERINDTIEQIEDQVLTKATPEVLQQIFDLRHSLSYLRKTVSPQLEVFNRLISRDDEYVDRDVAIYFRDVYDHLVRTFEAVDSYRDLMSSAMDAYLSIVSNRQNEVMKRLTVFTSIFLPITFITGLFGQNFAHMPQVEHDGGYFWWIALGAMVVITASQLLYYRRQGWF